MINNGQLGGSNNWSEVILGPWVALELQPIGLRLQRCGNGHSTACVCAETMLSLNDMKSPLHPAANCENSTATFRGVDASSDHRTRGLFRDLIFGELKLHMWRLALASC